MPKLSQQAANYRRGTPVKQCAVCVYFSKASGDANGICSKVAGKISPYGVSDSFYNARNDFGPRLGPAEVGAIDEMMQSEPDRSRFVAQPVPQQAAPGAGPGLARPPGGPIGPPPLRIGSKRY